jgi:hypothetical protein
VGEIYRSTIEILTIAEYACLSLQGLALTKNIYVEVLNSIGGFG